MKKTITKKTGLKTIKVKNFSKVPNNFTGIAEIAGEGKRWYKEGKFHREDGPAVELINGKKHWYKEGNLHRKDGPACEWTDGTKYWYKEGKYHREDGPVMEYSNGDKYWYLEEEEYNPINLNDFVVLDHDKGKYGIMWYKLLDKDEIVEYPDIPGLITK